MRTRTSLKRRFGKAFTLIELLIVITIIGILAVALIPRVTQGPAKARDVKRKSDVQNIGTALELYYSENSSYPASPAGNCASGLAGDLADFTQAIPSDPDSENVPVGTSGCEGDYYYQQLGSAFIVVAHLERATTGEDNVYCSLAATNIGSTYAETINATHLGALVTGTCVEDAAYYVTVR